MIFMQFHIEAIVHTHRIGRIIQVLREEVILPAVPHAKHL